MAIEIAGLPHWEVAFDQGGRGNQDEVDALLAEVPAQKLTDLLVFSHDWNNDRAEARRVYQLFFGQVQEPLAKAGAVGTLGVVWPSKRWADEPSPVAGTAGSRITGMGETVPLGPSDDYFLVQELRSIFPKADQRRALDELAELLAERPNDPVELKRFQALMASLARTPDAMQAIEDQGELTLVAERPEAVFARFASAVPRPAASSAAGRLDQFGLLWHGAREALRQLTYFEMKLRAGAIGKDGLGPLLGQLAMAASGLRIHLLGHSLSARLVSYALAGLPSHIASPVKSLYLLQGAFSHFAFADRLPMDPVRGGALKGKATMVDGPLIASFSIYDLAVGQLYPLASLSSRDDAAGAEDLLYRWGGMGHDGAQGVNAQVVSLGPVGAAYHFPVGRFTNLDCSAIVNRGGLPSGAHADIFHPELVWVALAAAELVDAA